MQQLRVGLCNVGYFLLDVTQVVFMINLRHHNGSYSWYARLMVRLVSFGGRGGAAWTGSSVIPTKHLMSSTKCSVLTEFSLTAILSGAGSFSVV
jgi:hypothetical protein